MSDTTSLACSSGICSLDGDCGTGDFDINLPPRPQPGEPNNTTYLVAVPTFGGVRVTWTLPSLNPHGVAFVRIFRSDNTVFDNAVNLGTAGGNTYFDPMDNSEDVTLYYWIQIVTIANNALEPVGPAKAEKRAFVSDLIEHLTGEIDAGVLSQQLKTEIQKITLNHGELMDEIANRIASNKELAAAFAMVQQGLLESIGLIHNETEIRTNGMEAMARQMNIVAAANIDAAAAIIAERTARVTAMEAYARTVDGQFVAFRNETAAAIQTVNTTIATLDSAVANRITTVQSQLQSNIASVQSGADTYIRRVEGKVTEIGAMWSAKVSVNGLVGGFGVYNDGRTVEAGFEVDKFWVGTTNANKRKPFIIYGGITYIDDAMIRRLTFDKFYSSDGNLVFENGVLRAKHLIVDTPSITNGAITSIDSSNWSSSIIGHNASDNTPSVYVNAYDANTRVIVNFNSSGNIRGPNDSGGDTYYPNSNAHIITVYLYRNGINIYNTTIYVWNAFDGVTGKAMGAYVPINISYKDSPGAGTHSYRVMVQISNMASMQSRFESIKGHINACAYKK